jgi:predicted ATPase
MIKNFFVDNFKTHVNTNYELHPVNLLIGTNNSGKTNLLQALRFLGLTSIFPLSKAATIAANEDWTLSNVYIDKKTMDFRLDADLMHEGENCSYQYELSLRMLSVGEIKDGKGRIAIEQEKLTVKCPGHNPVQLIINKQGQIKLLNETRWKNNNPDNYIETSAPIDATMLSRLYDLKHNPLANHFKQYLSSWLYYDLDPSGLRKPEARILESVLFSDGGNLASVLFNLKNGNERLYRKIVDLTRKTIDPRLEILSFFSPAENVVLMFAEDQDGHRFGPWSMSNGTLRFMALAYVLLSNQFIPGLGEDRLTLIEEPETGLYVGHLKEIIGLIKPQSQHNQLIFTSQSPYFIDLFDGMLESVTVVQRGERTSRLIRPDTNKLKENLKDMALGELHFREMLV